MINYLIIAHNNPNQIKKLVLSLRGNNNRFYIHIDKSQNLDNYEDLINGDDILFIRNRIHCVWAHYNFVIVVLRLINEVISSVNTGKLVLLSGQCFPIRNRREIENLLNVNDGLSYIDMRKVNEVWGDSIFEQRVSNFRFDFSTNRGDFKLYKPIRNFEDFVLYLKDLYRGRIKLHNFLILLFANKTMQNRFEFYGGSAWWILDYSLSKDILNFYKMNKYSLDNFFKYCHVPDEYFFQTLIFHLKGQEYQKLTRPSLTYVDWHRKGVPLPVTFVQNDYDHLQTKRNNYLFARKFSSDIDEEIINRISESLNK